MKAGGVDIGSRFIKYVLLDDGRPIAFEKRETGHQPLRVCNELIMGSRPDRLVATGYGRYLLEVHGDTPTITEIRAVALGARHLFPASRTIVDIGGQDTKVVSLNKDGTVVNFEMNDRCAAGTGKFLEVMAKALGYSLEEMGSCCEAVPEGIKINSMCTVFAESEVISLITKGVPRKVIAAALHRSIVNKVAAMIMRVGLRQDVVFAGGCARNACLREMFEERLKTPVLAGSEPEMMCAFGAALHAAASR